jgi:hypothetical protein
MGQTVLPFDRAFLPPSPIRLRPAGAGLRRDVDWLCGARTQTGVNAPGRLLLDTAAKLWPVLTAFRRFTTKKEPGGLASGSGIQRTERN